MTNTELTLTDVGTAQSSGCGCGCGCGSTGAAAEPSGDVRGASDVVTRYGVAGMTCGHCVGAVTDELSALDGVRDVQIDLVAGGTSSVTVTSSAPLDEESVRAAVDEAGYELTGRLR